MRVNLFPLYTFFRATSKSLAPRPSDILPGGFGALAGRADGLAACPRGRRAPHVRPSRGLPLDAPLLARSLSSAAVQRASCGGFFASPDVQAVHVAIKRWEAFGSPNKGGDVPIVVTTSGSTLYGWGEGDWRPVAPPWSVGRSGPRVSRGGLVDSAITDRCTSTVAVYRRDVRVSRVVPRSGPPRSSVSSRGKITRFSVKSQNNLRFIARNLKPLGVLLTLTYPSEFPCDGNVVKRDWAAMRKWLCRRGLGGLQVLEFHERGAPHIHAYLSGRVDKKEVAEAWYRIVGSGDLKHLAAGTRIEKLRKMNAMSMYVVKYISKERQKQVPEGFENVGRFWSLFGGVRLTPECVLQGERSAVAPVVRIVRGLVNSRRRRSGIKPMHDRGGRGWQAWEVAPAIIAYCDRLGVGPDCSMSLSRSSPPPLRRSMGREAEAVARSRGDYLAWGGDARLFR